MRGKALLILAVVTVAIVGVAGWAVFQRNVATDPATAGGPTFPELAAQLGEISVIQIAGSKGEFEIRRAGDDRWIMPGKDGYSARRDKVVETANALATMRRIDPRTDNPELYDRLGVGEPGKEGSEAVKVTLLGNDNEPLAVLIVGKPKVAASGSQPAEIYVRKPDEPQSWLVETRLEMSDDPMNWIDRELVKIERDKVREVIIDHPKGATVRIFRPETKAEEKADEKAAEAETTDEKAEEQPAELTLADLPKGRTVEQYRVDAVAEALASLSLEDVKKAETVEFDADPTVVRYRTVDDLELTIRLVKLDGKSWARFEAKGSGEAETQAADLDKRLAGWAYRLPDGRVQDMTPQQADLLKPEEKKEEEKTQ